MVKKVFPLPTWFILWKLWNTDHINQNPPSPPSTLFAFFFFFSRVTEILKYREIIWWRDAASRWASWLTSRMSQFRLVSPTWPIKMHTITKQQVARVIWFWYIRIAISFLFFYTGVTSNAGHDYFYWFSLTNLDL